MLGAPEAVIVLFVESFGTSVIMSLIFSETTNIALTFVLEVKDRVVPGIKLEFLYTPTQSPAAAEEPLFIENEITYVPFAGIKTDVSFVVIPLFVEV